jgi:hypothetical protein
MKRALRSGAATNTAAPGSDRSLGRANKFVIFFGQN